MTSFAGLRLIVLGYMVRGPLGGMAWHYLQYLLGLSRMGHDVWFVEIGDDFPSCYDPEQNDVVSDPTYGLGFVSSALERLELGGRFAYLDVLEDEWLGPASGRIDEIVKTADVVINVSGVNPLIGPLLDVPVRILIDTDPAFTQIRHVVDPQGLELANNHNAYATFGASIPAGTSAVPDDGLNWIPTRQPVFLDAWPVTPGPIKGDFTTIMQWNSYPAQEFDGKSYGMKSTSFEDLFSLPAQSKERFLLGVGGPDAPRGRLRSSGWNLANVLEITRDPWTFRRFVNQSKGELGVAKHGYILGRTGWFSERSAAYLASGRPVLAQDTGFSDHLPMGEGVIAFSTKEDVLAGIEEINSRYREHCRSAREFVESHFESGLILQNLLEHVFSEKVEARTSL